MASNVNAVDRRASTSKIEVEGLSTLRGSPAGRDPERTVLYLHGGGYCFGSWGTHKSLITHLAVASEAVVRELGCEFAQGFLFAKPLKTGELDELLELQQAQGLRAVS